MSVLLSCGAEETPDACQGTACVDTGAPCEPEAQLYINEFQAKNNRGLTDESGKAEDWIELYNGTGAPVDVGGMFISDDPDEPTRSQLPTDSPDLTTIEPGGYLLLWADKDREEGGLHRDIKLSSSGESILLFEADGVTLVDSVDFGTQRADVSYGRSPDGCDAWVSFTTPTPGSTNP